MSDIHALIPQIHPNTQEFNTHVHTYSVTLDIQNTEMHTNTHHDTHRYTGVSTNTQPDTHNINYSSRHTALTYPETHINTQPKKNRFSNIATSPNMYRCTGRSRDTHVNIIRHKFTNLEANTCMQTAPLG